MKCKSKIDKVKNYHSQMKELQKQYGKISSGRVMSKRREAISNGRDFWRA